MFVADMPRVSVVIPVYNRENTIENSIASVLSQSVADLEAVVVDDGSNDNTLELIEKIARVEPRVRLVRHTSNRGAQAARNSGIRAARGKWIAFLDSDDTWLPRSLEVRLAAARFQHVHVVHSPGYRLQIGEERELFEVPPLSGNIYRQMLEGQGPLFPALLVTAEALRTIGGLDEAIVAYQEWDTAIRLAQQYEFAFVPEATFVYDCRGFDTISKNLLRGAIGYEQIVRKHLLEILRWAGPRCVSRHCAQLSAEYRTAGNEVAAQRWRRRAFLWWPSPRRAFRRAVFFIRSTLQ